MDVESRAARLILRAEAPLIPLSQLHRALAAEAGTEAGDVATLRERLHARPDLFLLLERPSPLAGAEHWPEGDRVAYRAALRDAGFEAETLVGAAPAADDGAGGAPARGAAPRAATGGLDRTGPANGCADAASRVAGAGAGVTLPTPGCAPAGAFACGRMRGYPPAGPALGVRTAASVPGYGRAGTPVPGGSGASRVRSAPAHEPPARPVPETPAARVAAALAQLAATVPEEHLLRGRLADALPLAEATMRVLAEAWRARQQAEAEGWVPGAATVRSAGAP